jgi:hypothetical protein
VATNAAERRLFLSLVGNDNQTVLVEPDRSDFVVFRSPNSHEHDYEKGASARGKAESLLDPVEARWASEPASSITTPIVAMDFRARRSRDGPE